MKITIVEKGSFVVVEDEDYGRCYFGRAEYPSEDQLVHTVSEYINCILHDLLRG